MKTRYLMLLLGCLFLQLQSIFSQTENSSLYIPPTDCAVGSLATVPIMLSNDAEIVALQFDMHIPDVVQLADPGITLTDRKNGHTITVKILVETIIGYWSSLRRILLCEETLGLYSNCH